MAATSSTPDIKKEVNSEPSFILIEPKNDCTIINMKIQTRKRGQDPEGSKDHSVYNEPFPISSGTSMAVNKDSFQTGYQTIKSESECTLIASDGDLAEAEGHSQSSIIKLEDDLDESNSYIDDTSITSEGDLEISPGVLEGIPTDPQDPEQIKEEPSDVEESTKIQPIKIFTNIDKQFLCPICHKLLCLDKANSWDRHLKAHRDRPMLYCDICGLACNSKHRFQEHRRIHMGQRPHKCDECGKRFSRVCSLTQHKAIHRRKVFKCNYCGKLVQHLYQIIEHMKSHGEGRPYMCHLCGARFKDALEISSHINIHSATMAIY